MSEEEIDKDNTNNMNYKITIQYDGTRYKGWQIQKNSEDTIQGKLVRILSGIEGETVDVIGSGRTDAGVHARGQVANFHLKKKLSEQELLGQLNHYLPEDIAVLNVERVSERFHSRYQAVSKTYVYRIHVSAIPNVFERRFVYSYEPKLDVMRMREAAKKLIGTHDFASFCGNRHFKKSTIRTIDHIDLTEIPMEDGSGTRELRISYTGDGFLQNMVRILTGTLIEIGDGRRSLESIEEILAARDRSAAGYTAPPQGLCLESVSYEEVPENDQA